MMSHETFQESSHTKGHIKKRKKKKILSDEGPIGFRGLSQEVASKWSHWEIRIVKQACYTIKVPGVENISHAGDQNYHSIYSLLSFDNWQLTSSFLIVLICPSSFLANQLKE